jgi:hypothetical protein
MKDPVQCSSSHIFCRRCIVGHLTSCSETCPTCREPLTKEKLLPNGIICSLIEDAEVRCFTYIHAHQEIIDSTVESCEWLGKLKDAEQHYHQCRFAQTSCPHDGCDEIFMQKDLPRHIKDCVHVLAMNSTWGPRKQSSPPIDPPLPPLLPCSDDCLDLKGSVLSFSPNEISHLHHGTHIACLLVALQKAEAKISAQAIVIEDLKTKVDAAQVYSSYIHRLSYVNVRINTYNQFSP